MRSVRTVAKMRERPIEFEVLRLKILRRKKKEEFDLRRCKELYFSFLRRGNCNCARLFFCFLVASGFFFFSFLGIFFCDFFINKKMVFGVNSLIPCPITVIAISFIRSES